MFALLNDGCASRGDVRVGTPLQIRNREPRQAGSKPSAISNATPNIRVVTGSCGLDVLVEAVGRLEEPPASRAKTRGRSRLQWPVASLRSGFTQSQRSSFGVHLQRRSERTSTRVPAFSYPFPPRITARLGVPAPRNTAAQSASVGTWRRATDG